MPVRFEFRVTKWPPNDLKWPIRTWKHNFLTKSPFGACHMSFHRYFGTLTRLRLSDLSSETPNDLKMTSQQVTIGHLRSFGGHFVSRNSNLTGTIDSVLKKTYEKNIWHAPKWDLVRKLRLQVTIGHLRSFGGHLVIRNTNLMCAIDSEYQKT